MLYLVSHGSTSMVGAGGKISYFASLERRKMPFSDAFLSFAKVYLKIRL